MSSSSEVPEDTDVLHLLGLALTGLERFDEAIDLFRRAEDLSGDTDVYSSHIDALRALGRTDETVDVARAAAKAFPKDAQAHHLLGTALVTQGAIDDAVEEFRYAVELDPKRSGAAAELGDALRRRGDYEDALEWVDLAIGLKPDSVYAVGTRGQVLLRLNRRDEAVAELRRAAELAGEAIPGWLVLELAAALEDEATPKAREEALTYLDRHLASNPGDAQMLADKADLLRLLDRPAEGLDAAEEALTAARAANDDATAGGILGTKSNLLIDLYRPEEALAAADEALACAATEESARNFARSGRIRALVALNRHAEAMEEVDQYVAAAPEDPWGLLIRAAILTDYRDFGEAEKILEQTPDMSATVAGFLGLCRNRLGRPQQAIEPLERAVDNDPRLWWCVGELALARRDTGDRKGCDEILGRLVDEAGTSDEATPRSSATQRGRRCCSAMRRRRR